MKNKNLFIGIAVIVIAILLFGNQLGLFSSTGASVSRSVQNTATPGSTVVVTYTASGTGNFGISIVDTLSGSCQFSNGKTEYKDVILSDGSLTRTMNIIVGNSGQCNIQGDYKSGIEANVNFPSATITISTTNVTCSNGQTKCEGTVSFSCSNNAWVNQGQIDGQCGYVDEVPDEVPTLSLDKVLFKIGEFEVTILYVLIALGGLFIIKMVFSK